MGSAIDKIKRLFRRTARSAGELVDGEPVATPPPGAASSWEGDPERETSTNAQVEGAAGEPWGGNT